MNFGQSNGPKVGRPVRRLTSVTQNEADEVTKPRTRMVLVGMQREKQLLHPLLKPEDITIDLSCMELNV